MTLSPEDEKNRKFMQDLINAQLCRFHGIPEKPMNTLDKAKQTVDSSRQAEYGDPVENWVATALIATITQRKSITPEDVVQVMTAQKSVRAGRSYKEDTNVDQAGYAEIRDRVQKAFADGTVQKIVEKLLGGWVKFGEPKKPANAILVGVEYNARGEGIMRRNEPYITFRIIGPLDTSGISHEHRIEKV